MTDAAVRVWDRMRELVLDNDRRREVVDALGMSFVKAKALRRIAERPMTMRELAEELLTDRPYATVLVDDLEQRGLVARTVHPDDRRRKIVSATETGLAAAATASKILSVPPSSLLALPPADLAALDTILATVGSGELGP
jgi:DNA-binding MarR family transcriptional regulator